MLLLVVGDWRGVALRGVAAVVFGALALVWPAITLDALVLLFGVYALVDAVGLFAALARGAPEARARRTTLVAEGLLSLAAAVVAFLWPDITALALLYVIAAWAVLTGIVEIVAAVRLRREIQGEWLLALSGALSLVFAAVLVVRPRAGALAITWVIGLYAVLFGGALLALAWRLRQLQLPLAPRGTLER